MAIEQEYLVLEYPYTWKDGELVSDCVDFSYNKINNSKTPHYCSTHKSMNKGREVSETHYTMCLLAGL